MTMIFLVSIFTFNGQDYSRREPMPSIEVCWVKAAELWQKIYTEHQEVTGFGVGCAKDNGDPA